MSSPKADLLRIAVVGLGGIGSGVALKLAGKGHHEVTAVVRPSSQRFEQLARDNAVISETGESGDILVATALDEQIPYDLVIVTVMVHQVAPLLPALKSSAAKKILFYFNDFNPEALRDEVGADRALFGMPFIQAYFNPTNGHLHLNIPRNPSLVGDQTVTDIFNAAGMPTSYEPNMLLWLRCHTPLCIALESASYAGVQREGGATWSQCMTSARGVHESFRLIQSMGYNLYPGVKVWANRSPAFTLAALLYGLTRIRAVRELLARGAVESQALIDIILETAPEAKTPIKKERIAAMKLGHEIR